MGSNSFNEREEFIDLMNLQYIKGNLPQTFTVLWIQSLMDFF